jgi:hypothetical protein
MTTLRGASACTVKRFRDQTTVLTAVDGFRSQRSSRNMRNTQARDLREFFISQLISPWPSQLLLCGIELRQSGRRESLAVPPQRFCWSALFGFLLRRAIPASHLRILAIARVVQFFLELRLFVDRYRRRLVRFSRQITYIGIRALSPHVSSRVPDKHEARQKQRCRNQRCGFSTLRHQNSTCTRSFCSAGGNRSAAQMKLPPACGAPAGVG